MTDPHSKLLVLDELRRAFDKVYAAGDALDTKLQNLLSFSSLVVSIAASAQVSILQLSPQLKIGPFFGFSLCAVITLYLVMYYIISKALSPREYALPIATNKDEIREHYYKKQNEEALNQLISNHLHFIDRAARANAPKAKTLTSGYFLLAVIVVWLILAVPLGLLSAI